MVSLSVQPLAKVKWQLFPNMTPPTKFLSTGIQSSSVLVKNGFQSTVTLFSPGLALAWKTTVRICTRCGCIIKAYETVRDLLNGHGQRFTTPSEWYMFERAFYCYSWAPFEEFLQKLHTVVLGTGSNLGLFIFVRLNSTSNLSLRKCA